MNLEIANRLVDYRKKAGLSQEELADKLGISRQAVSKWERVEASPDTDNLIALANLYGITLDELIYGGNKSTDTSAEPEVEKVEAEVVEDKERVHVDFHKGIHVHAHDPKDGDVKVDIGNKGIHVRKNGKEINLGEKFHTKHLVSSILSGISIFGVLIFYLVWGFNTDYGFVQMWPLFIAIPILPSIAEAIMSKRITKLGVPFIVTTVYCFLGTLCDGWHPWWVLFLIIPAFYAVFGPIDKMIHKEPIENEEEKD